MENNKSMIKMIATIVLSLLMIGSAFLITSNTNAMTANAQTTNANAYTTQAGAPMQYPWGAFHGNIAGTGFTLSPAPETDHLLWKTLVSSGGSRHSFAVAGGMVYTSDGLSGSVMALDADTGQMVWRTFTGRMMTAQGVTYASSTNATYGRIYVESDAGGNYSLMRLDAVTGAIQWTYIFPLDKVFATGTNNTVNEDGGTYRVGIPDVVVSPLTPTTFTTADIYVAAGDTLFALEDQYDNQIYQRDPQTLVTSLWNFTLTEPSTYGFVAHQSPVIDTATGMVFAASYAGDIYALNETTGAQIWNYSTGSTIGYTGCVADGMVFWGTLNGVVHALNENTGKETWAFNATSTGVVSQGPSVAYGRVYVTTYESKTAPDVFCLNESTGQQLWTFNMTGASNGIRGCWQAPTIADGKVFLGLGIAGWIQVLDAYNGTLLWQKPLLPSGPEGPGPVVVDGRLYIQSGDGYMYCFGQGPSSTTLSATTQSLASGQTTTLYGTITDQSPASPNAAIAGVPVDLYQDSTKIATVTTASDGTYNYAWTPSTTGFLNITANFAGNGAEMSSSGTVMMQVSSVAATPTPVPIADKYFVPAIVGLFVLIIVVAIVLALLMLRKRP